MMRVLAFLLFAAAMMTMVGGCDDDGATFLEKIDRIVPYVEDSAEIATYVALKQDENGAANAVKVQQFSDAAMGIVNTSGAIDLEDLKPLVDQYLTEYAVLAKKILDIIEREVNRLPAVTDPSEKLEGTRRLGKAVAVGVQKGLSDYLSGS